MKRSSYRWVRPLVRVTVGVLLIVCLLAAPPAALAQKKKKEEAEQEKSYVFSYFIVMVLVGVGLMTVCRPNSRQDAVDKKKTDEDG